MRTPVPPGLVLVDKPGGLTSHDVVARVRRLAGTRKVGHAGTLDPMATGLLIIGVDRATRLLGHLSLDSKAYAATVRLGVGTDTDDAEGSVVSTADLAGLTESRVREALAGFVGDIEQVPSSVSAVKVDGRRAYARVRAGEEVELPARPVTIHSLDLHALDLATGVVEITVRCSSGTYVRAIARDLGARLGVGGHLTRLRRTSAGAFDVAAAATLEDLAEDLRLLPIETAARRVFPSLDLDAEASAAVRFGRPIERSLKGPTALFDPDGTFLALHRPSVERPGHSKPVAVFV